MANEDTIRERVSRDYAKAVSTPKSSCCCDSSKSNFDYAELAGYSREELEAIPDEAVEKSFGCGNPLAFSEVKEGETVLDLGSGAGIDLFLAARKVGVTGRVIGVDMTDEMIAKARANIDASDFDNIEVRKGIIEQMPVDDASVDWVISNCVINLSPDKPAVFREIARVLKPGGRMAVSDVVVDDLPDWARRDVGLYSSCVAGAISQEEYVQGLRDAGLEDVQVTAKLRYDEAQLETFMATESAAATIGASRDEGESSCCGGGGSDAGAERQGKAVACAAGELAGKILSAKFTARKPGGGECCGDDATTKCCN